MTSYIECTIVSFTSGELLDIMSALVDKADNLIEADQHHLATYYTNMAEQFEILHDKVQDLIPENRVAKLVLVAN
jgi:hypothetical protein